MAAVETRHADGWSVLAISDARHSSTWAVHAISDARHSTGWGIALHGARHAAGWAVHAPSASRHAAAWAGLTPGVARHAELHAGMVASLSRHVESHAGMSVVSARNVSSYCGMSGISSRHAATHSGMSAVRTRHAGLYAGMSSLNARHAESHAGMASIAARNAAAYAGMQSARARHETRHDGLSVVASRHSEAHAGMPVVSVRHADVYSGMAVVGVRHSEVHAGLVSTSSRNAVSFGGLVEVATSHRVVFSLTSPTAARHVSSAALLEYNPVSARNLAVWSMPDASIVTVSGDTYLTHAGRRIEVGEDTTVSADEGSPFWIASLDILGSADFSHIAVGDELTLTLWGSTVELVCDGRRMSRSAGAPRMTVSAISPLALVGAPWAHPVTLESAGMAQAAVESLLGSVDWTLPDWPVPAAVDIEAEPLEIARQIAAAAGGLVESAPDGSVRVRPRYPISVPDYASRSVETITDRDLLGQSDSAEASALENRFVITSGDDASASNQIQIEAEQDEDDPHAYIVRAYPWPWRPVSLVHTGDGATTIGVKSEVTVTQEQLVEILAGEATASYPVDAVISAEYQHVDLGQVKTDGAAITTNSPEYSQINLTYRARAWEWRVTNASVETIQFLAIE